MQTLGNVLREGLRLRPGGLRESAVSRMRRAESRGLRAEGREELASTLPQPLATSPPPFKRSFAKRFRGGGQHLRHAKRLGQVSGDAQIDGFDCARRSEERRVGK